MAREHGFFGDSSFLQHSECSTLSRFYSLGMSMFRLICRSNTWLLQHVDLQETDGLPSSKDDFSLVGPICNSSTHWIWAVVGEFVLLPSTESSVFSLATSHWAITKKPHALPRGYFYSSGRMNFLVLARALCVRGSGWPSECDDTGSRFVIWVLPSVMTRKTAGKVLFVYYTWYYLCMT